MSTVTKLLLSYLFLIPPFMCAGAALGLLFMQNADRMYGLYFADLGASALAALFFVVFLMPMGGPGLIWLAAILAFAAFLAHAWAALPRRIILGFGAAFVALAALCGPNVAGRTPEPYKTLGRYLSPGWKTAKIEATRWTPITRIDVVSDRKRELFYGRLDTAASQLKSITQDGDAPTFIQGPARVEAVANGAASGKVLSSLETVYHLNPKPSDALVIGVGGGVDIVKAHAFSAQNITGVEINPATVALLQGQYRNFAVWPTWPNVKEVREDGRHFIRRNPGRFDTIVMSGIDTFSALTSGAYVLSENYLYTQEAFGDYFRALKPGGTMAIFRWLFPQPRESLRLSNLALSAMEARGQTNPAGSVMVISEDVGWDYRWATTLIKPRPFTPDEVRMVLRLVATNPKLSAVYVPKVFGADQSRIEAEAFGRDTAYLARARAAFQGLFQTAGNLTARHAFENSYAYRINPTFDDRPFFFEYYKAVVPQEAIEINGNGHNGLSLSSIRGGIDRYVLWILLACSSLAGVAGMILPLLIFNRRGITTTGFTSIMLFFGALGLGFMIIEIGLIQKLTLFIGDPMSAMAVVLAGLLMFTGLGSWLAGRLGWTEARNIRVGTLGVAIAAPVTLAVVALVLPAFPTVGLPARSAIVLMTLAPIGLLLGFPFASGVSYLGHAHETAIPWAWGVNGLASVVASVLTIIGAMRFGFTVMILCGALVYVGAFLAFAFHSATMAASARHWG